MPDTTQVTSSIANTSTAVSAATGTAGAAMSMTDWLSGNALIITLSCTVLSFVVGFIFHIINTRMTHRRDSFNRSVQKANMISKFRSEGKTQEEIEQILKLAGLN